jgi:hypothetical protein
MAGGDNYRMARTRDAMVMMVRGTSATHAIVLIFAATLDLLHLPRVTPLKQSSFGFHPAPPAHLEKMLLSVVVKYLLAGLSLCEEGRPSKPATGIGERLSDTVICA